MSTIRGLAHPTLQTPQTGADATWQVPRVGLALALLAVLGLGLALIGQAAPAPITPVPAPVEPTAPEPPMGDIPILGDPVRDLTVWYSDRVRDANRAALDNLQGPAPHADRPAERQRHPDPVRPDGADHDPAADLRRPRSWAT